ncbi:zinc transporter ZIP1-like [Tachysurus vachellii]|nr:zinc transporter ZIP1-like [Tachysurus vachellii]
MMSLFSTVVNCVGFELVCVLVYVVCVLVCGFGTLGALRMTWRSGTHSDARLSSLSCISAGVFLASCLLDIIPNFLKEMRETFTELSVTLYFPVPEFIMSVGFLFLLVMEQLILTLRDEREQQHGQKEGREDKEALLLCSPTVRTRPDPSLSPIRSSVLLLSLCLFFICQGLSVDVVRLRPELLLRTSLVTCSLVFLLIHSHMRRFVVLVCLGVLSSAFPLGLALRYTHTHHSFRLARSTLQGLSVGSFIYVVFMDVMPRVTSANEQRIAKVTLILTGFSVFTAALLL